MRANGIEKTETKNVEKKVEIENVEIKKIEKTSRKQEYVTNKMLKSWKMA